MRIFIDPIEMHKEVERDLFEMGTRYQTQTVQDKVVDEDARFQTIELFGYAYQLHNINAAVLERFLVYCDLDVGWAHAELQERLFGLPQQNDCPRRPLNPGDAWERRRTFWEPFLRGGKFSYTYSERWQEQLDYIVDELHNRPNTRQALMTMYDRHQDMLNWGGRDRVPCSISYQFMRRDDALHVVYTQRSCDFVAFFPYDVFFTCKLLMFVAAQLGIAVGTFTHFLGSLHAFAKDLEGRNIF